MATLTTKAGNEIKGTVDELRKMLDKYLDAVISYDQEEIQDFIDTQATPKEEATEPTGGAHATVLGFHPGEYTSDDVEQWIASDWNQYTAAERYYSIEAALYG